jgi:hypothetical protein
MAALVWMAVSLNKAMIRITGTAMSKIVMVIIIM